jgi:hypothetical protein
VSRHLSELELDTAAGARALGDAVPLRSRWHLWRCAACCQRLADRRAENDAGRAAGAYGRVAERVFGAVPVARPRRARTRPVFWVAPAVVAAGLLLWGLRPAPRAPAPDLRAKGSVAQTAAMWLELTAAVPALPRESFRVGERASIRVRRATAGQVVVLGVERSGAVSQVWPPSSSRSGALPPDGLLAPAFTVTEGDLLLLAWVSDRPVAVPPLLSHLRRRVGVCQGRALEPACLFPEPAERPLATPLRVLPGRSP